MKAIVYLITKQNTVQVLKEYPTKKAALFVGRQLRSKGIQAFVMSEKDFNQFA